jgi:hypothetical protein
VTFGIDDFRLSPVQTFATNELDGGQTADAQSDNERFADRFQRLYLFFFVLDNHGHVVEKSQIGRSEHVVITADLVDFVVDPDAESIFRGFEQRSATFWYAALQQTNVLEQNSLVFGDFVDLVVVVGDEVRILRQDQDRIHFGLVGVARRRVRVDQTPRTQNQLGLVYQHLLAVLDQQFDVFGGGGAVFFELLRLGFVEVVLGDHIS